VKTIANKNAMKVFYYLLAVDGDVSSEEIESLDNIGCQVDSDEYFEYKNNIISSCKKHIASAIEGEKHYDVILKGINKALRSKSNSESQGVPVRFIVWNMLAMAFNNDEYSDIVKAVITNVVYVTKMDRSVFLEMEQHMQTVAAIVKENERIQASGKPYSEVRPFVEELEYRQKVILESAMALIGDEVERIKEYKIDDKRTMIDDAKIILAPKVIPVASEIGKKTKTLASDAKKMIEQTDFKEEANKLKESFKSLKKDFRNPFK